MDRFVADNYKTPVICDRDKNSELILAGVFFLNGSSDEQPEYNGINHLIEHMVFKGTKKYSARDISFKVESLGGYLNAYTTKEYTCFYIKMLKENFKKLVDILSSICFEAVFNENEFEREKDVISAEISSIRDNPQEYLSEISESCIFKNQGYRLPIAGTIDSVKGIELNFFTKYYAEKFGSYGYFGALSGNFEDDELEYFVSKMPYAPFEEKFFKKEDIIIVKREFEIEYEQSYLSYYLNLDSIFSEQKYAYYLISYMLCESMSSRLFQRMREELGLCYNISSDVTLYRIGGYLSIDAEVNKSNVSKFDKYLLKELEILYKKGFRKKEMMSARNQILLNIKYGFEGALNRFEINAKQFMNDKRLTTPSEIEKKVLQYSLDELNHIFKKIYEQGIGICKTK
jgi:predicted Zn-dependent peptidase